MVDLIFRHYRKGDEEQLVNLFNIAFQRGGGTVRTPKNWQWRYIESPGFEPEMCQIAEDKDNNKIVGAVYVSLIETITLGQDKYLIADINDVTTHPDYREIGIATKLMEMSHDYMEKKGCDFAILSTGFKGIARSKLYQKFKYIDIQRGILFVQCPNLVQLIRDILGFFILFPVIFTLSYLPRFLNRMKIRLNYFFKDFSYEINNYTNHFEYMNAANRICSKYYEGYPEYDKSKFLWARIKIPAKRQRPTYIIIRKKGKIIGGSILTHQNIYSFKYGIKIRIGVIHEIFLEKSIFTNSKNLYLGYIYLIDKIMRAATQRPVGVLIYRSTFKDKDLNQAFKGMNFFSIKDSVIMIKELKPNLKFPQIKKPLFCPTYVSLGAP
jgi:ribosomal protein S18 acetylase RimI-like enzyme